MKRFLFLAILLVAPAVRADPVIQTWRDPDNPYDWRYYEREDGTRVICGLTILNNKYQAVTVPSFGNTVREIAPHAFENMAYLSTIRFPDCITNIGEYAFAGCSAYVANLPTNLTVIRKAAFKNCWLVQNGRSPAFPAGLETIEDEAFYRLNGSAWGESLVLPEGLKHIGDWAISYVWNAGCPTIPNSVTNIGSGVFNGLSEVSSFQLPPGLVSLGGEQTFSGCRSLREITLPPGMKRVGTKMFNWCTSLTNVIIPNAVESIGQEAFYFCTNLTSVTLPAHLKSISANAFAYCPLEGELTVPLNTAILETGAFADIANWTDAGPVKTLDTLRLPRQFEGRLNELALFGRNSRGKAISAPSGLQIVFYGPYNLRVESAYGEATPGGPVNHHEEGTAFSCSVSPAEINEPGIRRRCTGWTGTGDVPATGSGTNVAFTTTLKNSSLVWNWESDYLLSCSVSGAATPTNVAEWVGEGGALRIPFSPTVTPWRVVLVGDADGVVVDEDDLRISIPADRARTVTVEVEQGPLATETTPVPVPHAWLDRFPARLAACGGDYETFGNAQADNGRPVWACYVAGLTPTNALEDFRVFLSMEGERPLLSWKPSSGPDGEARAYAVWGKTNLTDRAWHFPTNDASRFFQVRVSLPEE